MGDEQAETDPRLHALFEQYLVLRQGTLAL
jgi:hypothetical protein